MSGSTVFIDIDAAGWGWSIGAETGQMDLLTVLLHEYGHALGLGHDEAAHRLMSSVLGAGAQARLIPLARSGLGLYVD